VKKTAVVILNWNGKQFLQDFLPDVFEHSKHIADVVVADNASSDGSAEWLETNMPQIKLIRNASNGGFAKGYNDALSQLPHTYFVLLNSDIEVESGWLDPLIAELESENALFAVQPKIISWHQRTHFEYAGASGGYIDLLGFPFCRGRIFENTEPDLGQYDTPTDIFWATGACMAIRAEFFRALGGFDEEFFAHMEEIDLCWRAQSMGYGIRCQPASKVYHIGGGTLPKQSSRKTFLNFRNNLLMLYKNMPTPLFLAILLPKLVLDGVAGIKFLAGGQTEDFRAIIRAHLYFYRRFARKKRSARRTAPWQLKGTFLGLIVFRHYLFGVKTFGNLSARRISR
jgi:GT2 family glycosyltransferase